MEEQVTTMSQSISRLLIFTTFCLLSMLHNAYGAGAATKNNDIEKKIAELNNISTAASAQFTVAQKNLLTKKKKLEQLQNNQHEVKLAKSQADIFLKKADTLLKEKQKTLTIASALKLKLEKTDKVNKTTLKNLAKAIASATAIIPKKKTEITQIQQQNAKATTAQKVIQQNIAAAKKLIATSKKQEEKAKHQAVLTKLEDQYQKGALQIKQAQQILLKAQKVLIASQTNLKKWNADTKRTSAFDAKTSAQLVDAMKKWKAAVEDVKATTLKIATSKKTIAEAPQNMKRFDGLIKTQQAAVNKAAQVVVPLQKEATTQLLAYEKIMLANGKMISFADKIAPIFLKKCVICHSHKKAEGQLDMQTFAGMMKGGESGVAIDLEDPEFSSLLSMIEDGSMPKDADPLPKYEIAIIKKWLTTGAQAGAETDPHASLIKIIPIRKHPLPPKTYRAALPVTALAFNPTGTILVSSGYHEVLLWNPIDGTLKQRISGIAQRVYDIAFSPDGSQLAIAAATPGEIGEVKLFDGKSGKQLANLLTTEDSISSIAFSPNGRQLAAAGADHLVHLIDIATKKEILTIKDHSNEIADVTFSSDGTQLATACRDKTVRVFNVKSGEIVKSFTKHNAPVNAVGFSSDGKQIISGGEDRRLRVWNIADGKEVRAITGFSSHITNLTTTADGMVYSVNKDRRLYQHKVADGKLIRRYQYHNDYIYSLAVNYSENIIASGSHDGEIRIWSSETGKQLRVIKAVPTIPKKVVPAKKKIAPVKTK